MRLPVLDVAQPRTTVDEDTHSSGAAAPPLTIRSSGLTHPGQVRDHNEDQFLSAVLSKALHIRETSLNQEEVYYGTPEGYLYLVADGVGGASAGERASALAVH